MVAKSGTVLVLHEGQIYEDKVVYLVGHAYRKCSFKRCTFVVREAPFVLEHCDIGGCAWHIDMVVHDENSLEHLKHMCSSIGDSLPRGRDDSEEASHTDENAGA